MDAHFWIFPWLSLFASCCAAVGGFLLSRRPPDDDTPPGRITPLLAAVWLAAAALMITGGLLLGGWAIIDYIPARGVLVGAIGGLVMSFAIRRTTIGGPGQSALLFGLSTALVAGSRLWLTHGELSGLSAMSFSLGATLLCFVASPEMAIQDSGRLRSATQSLIYSATLSSATLIGFSRTSALGDEFWADIPLMLGGALCIGLLFATLAQRFGQIARSVIVAACVAAVLIPLGITVAHSLPVIGLTALGLVAAALPVLLIGKSGAKELPVYLGFILLITGITVAFSLMAGYGLALFALGVLVVNAIVSTGSGTVPVAWSAFSALLLLYRLEILQNGPAVGTIGPADIWDLLAITLGILLPRVVATWVSDYDQKLSWSIAVQWLIAIAAPSLILDYIWQPRSLTGLFLGLAIGQVATVQKDGDHQANVNAMTSVLAALLLFLFLPGLGQFDAPTRTVRIACIVLLTGMAAIKILSHRRTEYVAAKAV